MGSFWGHIDEGLFFVLLAVWWMLHAFREYILAESKGASVKPLLSYDVHIKRAIPIENIFKVLFPIVGFLAEFFDGGVRFQDENGNFVKLIYQQHMTIYGIFIIHGIVDLLTWFKLPIFPSLNYMTAFMAFAWYGVAFYYHASMHGKEPVETAVHVMPIYIMFAISIAILLESKWRQGAWTMIVRSYGLLTLGTWFCHVAFMLYVSDRFPGGHHSDLDRSDPRNVTYVKAMFGVHLFVNFIICLIIYTLVYITLKYRLNLHIPTTKYGQERVLPILSKQNGVKKHRPSNHTKFRERQDNSTSEDSVLLLADQSQPL